MTSTVIKILISIVVFIVCSCNKERLEDIYITPRPYELKIDNGVFTINTNTSISVENKEQAKIVKIFTTLINNSTGSRITVSENNNNADIKLITDKTLTKEGSYILKVTKDNITRWRN